MQQLPLDPARDRARQNDIDAALTAYREKGGEIPPHPNTPESLRAIRWQIEELRVSVFAQQLGAQGKVSVHRIRKALAEIPERFVP